MTSASPLNRWEWREDRLENQDAWTRVDIPVDLDGAVTMVATITAKLPRSDRKDCPNKDYYQCHERGLLWHLMDSIDGNSWFSIANGSLYQEADKNVVRISSPLGLKLSLMLLTYHDIITGTWKDDDSPVERRSCPGPTTCDFDHSILKVTDIVLNVAVRSI
jgi:hypothetical protein